MADPRRPDRAVIDRVADVDRRLPRALHPVAWWIWAIGLATAASRTTNPLLLGLIIAVAAFVVSRRRTEAPWARGFRGYLIAGLAIVILRVVYRILFGGDYGDHVLITLPEIPLPDWAVGITLGGAITLESVLAAAYDGLRLATLIICIGAANVLADPRRLLRSVPSALYEMGATLVVAVSVAPQLVESVGRVRRARRLRGGSGRGLRALMGILIPVLEDALHRSLALAAAMDSRGYGRSAHVPARTRRLTGGLVIGGLIGICIGAYGVLDETVAPVLGMPMLVGGALAAIAGFALGGRRLDRTTYRPDPWTGAESLVAASGIAAAVLMFATGLLDPASLQPSLVPLEWPGLAPLATVGILIAALPAWLAPPVRMPLDVTLARTTSRAGT
jgi:energy-coupling factor transport system permease protein